MRPTHFTFPVLRWARAQPLTRTLAIAALMVGFGLSGCSTDPDLGALSTSIVVEEFGEWPGDASATAPEQTGSGLDTPAQSDVLPVGPPPETSASGTTTGGSTGAGLVSLDSALGNLERVTPAADRSPIGLSIGSIEILDAPVRSVGVTDTGEMEIPGPREVGWYRFGASPGQAGSAVLAAHIAFDGENGVFVSLTDLSPGDQLWVHFDDGTNQEFRVDALRQFDKDELPKDELFSETGEAQLALITCGGDFQPSVSSYEDNIVALATAVT